MNSIFKRFFLAFSLASTCLTFGAITGPSAVIAQEAPNFAPTDRVIVYHAPWIDIAASEVSDATDENASIVRESSSMITIVNLGQNLEGAELATAMNDIDNLPGVSMVVPDGRKFATVEPNDPKYDLAEDNSNPYTDGQWYLHNSSGTSTSSNFAGATNLQKAWDIETGSTSDVIAIIDTGYTDHVDLNDKILPGWDMIGADDGVSDFFTANDGNGRDSDAHDPGDWVTADEEAEYPDFCKEEDSAWHGTHVAGIAAAETNNSAGVAGVNWNAKILPVRVLGKCGGYTSDIADGIRWAAGGHITGATDNANPATAINLSLGGAGDCSDPVSDPYTQSAIDYAVNTKGIPVVVAAGNEKADAITSSPANCDNVIVVAATMPNGTRTVFSNFGSIVDIAAPGWDIYNTVNAGTTTPIGSTGTYDWLDGTSMATPIVAGIVSLMHNVDPTLTPAEIEQILKDSSYPFVTPNGNYDCRTKKCGAGLVDANNALLSVLDPEPPTTVQSATVNKTDVVVSWTASATTGATYMVTRNNVVLKSGVTATSYVDKNQATVNGKKTYRVYVVAPDGTRSVADDLAKTITLPSAPTILSVTKTSAKTFKVNIGSLPLSVSQWCIYLGAAFKTCVSRTSTSKSISVTAGTKYLVRTRATNTSGTSAYSNGIYIQM